MNARLQNAIDELNAALIEELGDARVVGVKVEVSTRVAKSRDRLGRVHNYATKRERGDLAQFLCWKERHSQWARDISEYMSALYER